MDSTRDTSPRANGIGWGTFALLLLTTVGVSVAATLWVARTWLFPQPFTPVVLDAREQSTLETKLHSLAAAAQTPTPSPTPSPTITPAAAGRGIDAVEPAPYVERPADRVIYFTQRELNALIARNPDLAGRLALHLSDELLSATMLVTLPPDLPVLAGHTVRVATGLRLRYEQGRPVVAVEGVSLMGVPLPSAWLGGLKGRDLVALHGAEGGFWHAFGAGVRDLRVEEGRLRVELAE
ncbi:MAG TPA: hypothetical protein PL143_19095 [Rhodocyclaceae bacterium]|nr:hypothetical protein [Rhodocyclaceae bacterium]